MNAARAPGGRVWVRQRTLAVSEELGSVAAQCTLFNAHPHSGGSAGASPSQFTDAPQNHETPNKALPDKAACPWQSPENPGVRLTGYRSSSRL